MLKHFEKLKIYHIPLAACFIVALTQFILSSSFTLTRWEGGGFGMYSEPNANYSRIVWISLKNSNGEIRIRLSPPDKDLSQYIKTLDEEKKNNWNKLIDESKRIRNFPRYRATNKFLNEIAQEFLSVNQKMETMMRRNERKINVNIDVFQIDLKMENKRIESKKLYFKTIQI